MFSFGEPPVQKKRKGIRHRVYFADIPVKKECSPSHSAESTLTKVVTEYDKRTIAYSYRTFQNSNRVPIYRAKEGHNSTEDKNKR